MQGRTSIHAILEVVENGSTEAPRKIAFHGLLVVLRIVFCGYGLLILLPVLTQDLNTGYGSSPEDEWRLEVVAKPES